MMIVGAGIVRCVIVAVSNVLVIKYVCSVILHILYYYMIKLLLLMQYNIVSHIVHWIVLLLHLRIHRISHVNHVHWAVYNAHHLKLVLAVLHH